PIDATDPTHQMFAVSPPPDAIVDHLDWRDNPYFPVELTREREYLLRVDPDAHAHVYGGECRLISNAAVLAGKWGIEAFDPGPVGAVRCLVVTIGTAKTRARWLSCGSTSACCTLSTRLTPLDVISIACRSCLIAFQARATR